MRVLSEFLNSFIPTGPVIKLSELPPANPRITPLGRPSTTPIPLGTHESGRI